MALGDGHTRSMRPAVIRLGLLLRFGVIGAHKHSNLAIDATLRYGLRMGTRTKPEPWTFEPREFIDVPKLFGKDSKPVPFSKPNMSPEEHTRAHAALLQHLIAAAVRRELKGQPLNQYVEDRKKWSGLRYNRLIRMQRGELQMQLSDMVAWAGRMPEVRRVVIAYLETMSSIDDVSGEIAR